MKRIISCTLVLSFALAGVAFGQVKAKNGVYFAGRNRSSSPLPAARSPP